MEKTKLLLRGEMRTSVKKGCDGRAWSPSLVRVGWISEVLLWVSALLYGRVSVFSQPFIGLKAILCMVCKICCLEAWLEFAASRLKEENKQETWLENALPCCELFCEPVTIHNEVSQRELTLRISLECFQAFPPCLVGQGRGQRDLQ